MSGIVGTGMVVPRHTRDDPIIVSPWHEVAIVKILRHDDERWRSMKDTQVILPSWTLVSLQIS